MQKHSVEVPRDGAPFLQTRRPRKLKIYRGAQLARTSMPGVANCVDNGPSAANEQINRVQVLDPQDIPQPWRYLEAREPYHIE